MTSQEVAIARVLDAIEKIKNGGMVIMVDDEDRENEGDLVFAATHVTAEKINFMTKEARGLICLSLDQSDVDRLRLPMMEDSTKSLASRETAFTVSIEAREGVTTGISAADRAQTIRVAVNDQSSPDDIVVPGHVFPLKARSGGVLQRAGHTEGSSDLARLAGLKPAGVICEIMNDDGSMARLPDLEVFSKKHDIPIVTIADLVTYRLQRESLIEEVHREPVKTAYGTFDGVLFRSHVDDSTHFALLKGEPFVDRVVDVRVHRQRPLVDVFGDPNEGGRRRVEYGLQMLANSEAGIFVYLSLSDPRAGFTEEFEELKDLQADHRPPRFHQATPMDSRMLGVGAQILRKLGVRKMCVHMSNPKPLKGLMGYDLEVVDVKEIKPFVTHQED